MRLDVEVKPGGDINGECEPVDHMERDLDWDHVPSSPLNKKSSLLSPGCFESSSGSKKDLRSRLELLSEDQVGASKRQTTSQSIPVEQGGGKNWWARTAPPDTPLSLSQMFTWMSRVRSFWWCLWCCLLPPQGGSASTPEWSPSPFWAY